jgi:hypothetical protein
MKPKQLAVLAVICVVFGAAGWIVLQDEEKDWHESNQKIGDMVFPGFAEKANDASKITIQKGAETFTLEKPDGVWVVKESAGYPADFTKVAGLVRALADLKVTSPIEISDADREKLALNPVGDGQPVPGHLVKVFTQDGALLASLLIGNEHMSKPQANSPFGNRGWPDGSYIMLPADNSAVLVTETFSNVRAKSDTWVDKTFFKVGKIKAATCKEGDTEVWSVSRDKESDSLTLAGDVPAGKEVDTSALSGIDSTLNYPSFNTVGGKSDGEHGWAEGRTFTATTFDGFTYTVRVGQKKGADYPLAVDIAYAEVQAGDGPEGETEDAKKARLEAHAKALADNTEKAASEAKQYGGWAYMVSSYVVDDLLKSRDELFKDKPKPKADEGAGATPPLPPSIAAPPGLPALPKGQ